MRLLPQLLFDMLRGETRDLMLFSNGLQVVMRVLIPVERPLRVELLGVGGGAPRGAREVRGGQHRGEVRCLPIGRRW